MHITDLAIFHSQSTSLLKADSFMKVNFSVNHCEDDQPMRFLFKKTFCHLFLKEFLGVKAPSSCYKITQY